MGIEFRPLDVAAIIIYLAGMAAMGIYFARRNQDTEEYFVGGRAFPGWAIGLSMLGTSISSVTFLAFPAAAYILDWRQLVSNLTLPIVAVLAVIVFIPFFRRGRLTSAFEYLGDRFGPGARLYGTISFIFLQLIRLSTVLFLVSIPVSLLTGTPMWVVIVAAGIFIAFYTVAGGIDAVIWTDVIQAIVLWLGGLVCFLYIAFHLPGGVGQIIAVGSEHGKFAVGAMKWSLNERTFWAVALLGIFNWLKMYSSDQNLVQRYVASRSMREARKATTLYSATAVPTWAFFFFVGTCVFVFYNVWPDPKVAALEADQVFPYFILTKIPAGIAGIVIAGVLAAAMSSLDSSINAIATISTVDILKPYLARGRDDRFYLFVARVIATAAAALMVVGAIIFSRIPKESMNDVTWIVTSVFGGCMMGMFMLGFFTRRVDYASLMIALVAAVLFNIYLGLNIAGWLPPALTINVHAYWVGILVNLLFAALAYGLSLVRRRRQPSLQGLTVWTMRGNRGA
ncbi:MAG: sodium:solute symporter [Armatimonadota bacterium]|jgi:SSS family solute:Na+ symporter